MTVTATAELVRALVRSTEEASLQKRNDLVQQFKAVDVSFPVTNNENLVKVMLSGCLAYLLDQREKVGTVAALSLHTATLGGLVRELEPPELFQCASSFLREEAKRIRENAYAPPAALPVLREVAAPKAVAATVEDFIATSQVEIGLKNDKALSASLTSTQKALSALASAMENVRKDSAAAFLAIDSRRKESAIEALQEETQVLWWLFGEWSDEANCEFCKLQTSTAALVLGSEFAKLTRFVPAHPQSASILGRALARCSGSDAAISLSEIVEASDIEWKKRTAATIVPDPVLTPLLFALARSSEAPGPAWREAFHAVSGISPAVTSPLTGWARQISDELLLMRALNNAAT